MTDPVKLDDIKDFDAWSCQGDEDKVSYGNYNVWSSEGGAIRGTIWLNNCQNSPKTRLIYIKISLKVDFYQEISGSGPHRIFFQKGAITLFALRARILKNTDYFRGGPGGSQIFSRANLLNTDLLPPPPGPLEKACIRA